MSGAARRWTTIDLSLEQASVFRALLVYRWLALTVPLATLLLPGGATTTGWLLFLVAIADNLVPTLLQRRVNVLVLRLPALFGVDLLLASGLIGASGGAASPYFLYALGPTLACAFFFGVRGGTASALAFVPLLATAAVLGYRGDPALLAPLLLSQVLILTGVAVAFGFLAQMLGRQRATAAELARLRDDLMAKNVRLQRSNLELQAIQELGMAIRDATTVDSVQERLLAILTTRFGLERAVIGLVDPTGQFITSWLAAGELDGDRSEALAHTTRVPLTDGASAVSRALAERKVYHTTASELAPLPAGAERALRMREFAVLPLICRERPVGVILVDNPRSGRSIGIESLDALTRLANQAALAIANVQMCVERARQQAVINERQRIAADLHDSVIQSMYGIVLNLQGCAGLVEQQPARVRAQLNELRSLAVDSLEKLRGAVYDLRNGEFGGAELVAALQRLAEETRRLSSLAVDVSVSGDVGLLDEASAKAFYRIAQEALSNAYRHSAGTQVTVDLSVANGCAALTLTDDGRGFDPAAVPTGVGLRTMRERAEAIGGQVAIESAPGRGTKIVATMRCCGVP